MVFNSREPSSLRIARPPFKHKQTSRHASLPFRSDRRFLAIAFHKIGRSDRSNVLQSMSESSGGLHSVPFTGPKLCAEREESPRPDGRGSGAKKWAQVADIYEHICRNHQIKPSGETRQVRSQVLADQLVINAAPGGLFQHLWRQVRAGQFPRKWPQQWPAQSGAAARIKHIASALGRDEPSQN